MPDPYRTRAREPEAPSPRAPRGEVDVEVAVILCAALALAGGSLAAGSLPPTLVAASALAILWALRGLVTTLRRR